MKRRGTTAGHADRATAHRVIWPSLAFVAVVAGTASYLDALTVMHAAIGASLVAYLVAILADPVILAAAARTTSAHANLERRAQARRQARAPLVVGRGRWEWPSP